MRTVLDFIRRAAAGYEPAVVASVAAAVFLLAAELGIQTGDLPEKVDAVLRFAQFIAPLIAGVGIRQKVTPVSMVDDNGKTPGDEDLHPVDEPEHEDPDHDLLVEPGEHKRQD
jgi:hypothetical protein